MNNTSDTLGGELKSSGGGDKANESSLTNNISSDGGAIYNTALPGAVLVGDLKIIGHLRNIERINEKRRCFLSNSSACNYSEPDKRANEPINGEICNSSSSIGDCSGATLNSESSNVQAFAATTNDLFHNNNNITNYKKTAHILQLRCADELLDSSSTDPDSRLSLTNKSPPPKPPMLSRHRSLGNSSDYTSSPLSRSPIKLPLAAAAATLSSPPKSPRTRIDQKIVLDSTTAKAIGAAQPKMTETPEPATRQQSPTASCATAKQISTNHYERLIEELRCPGCAFPMKGQVLLCKTGHSICAQCTRVLMMCPLCKEPFTTIRSLTVEALCSKAHFRCSNASGGCTVRLQIDLLSWHEKQCIYKPMKCFMGRVYGDCSWTGREANWKQHLEAEHSDKVFRQPEVELTWNMGVKQKPLTGYYVFEVYDEMFNFYEVNDRERILFTMSCTSTLREKKHNFAYEVTILQKENEALAITQKFPVHSEYDKDILLDGTCVSISFADLARFIDADRLLHYTVRVLEVKSPKKSKISRNSSPQTVMHPLDFQKTQIEGVNLKNVPADIIVTRKLQSPSQTPSPSSPKGINDETTSAHANDASATSSDDELERIRRRYNSKVRQSSKEGHHSDSDAEFEAFIAKQWSTPQLHFNRRYLKTSSSGTSSPEDVSTSSGLKNNNNHKTLAKLDDDKMSVCSTNTSYKQKVTNSLRKSIRTLKSDFIDMKPKFGKKSSPEKHRGPDP